MTYLILAYWEKIKIYSIEKKEASQKLKFVRLKN